MPVAVCDSSVLIHLPQISAFGLLREFYDSLLIPPRVWAEVVEQGTGWPGVDFVREAAGSGWLAVRAPAESPTMAYLRTELDPGEAEAIMLALELQPDVISFGRRVRPLDCPPFWPAYYW
jgi:uncharacterized protein